MGLSTLLSSPSITENLPSAMEGVPRQTRAERSGVSRAQEM